jgi:hypothetical protein
MRPVMLTTALLAVLCSGAASAQPEPSTSGLPAPRGARSGLRPRTSRSALTGGWGPPAAGLPATTATTAPLAAPPRVPLEAGRYRHPSETHDLEYAIERQVGDGLRATFQDARVRARLVRAQCIRLDIEVAMHGSPREKLVHILHFTRDATLVVFREAFNRIRIDARSRIRVTEADDRFRYDYRFLDLTPYAPDARADENVLFRRLRVERAWGIDMPHARALPRDAWAVSVTGTTRSLANDVYSAVARSRSQIATVGLRRGLLPTVEASLSYTDTSNDVVPSARGVLASSGGALTAVSVGARTVLPFQVNGATIAAGVTRAYQPGDERRFYLPDDFERLYNLYVVASRRVFDNILVHFAAKRTSITLAPDTADGGIDTIGLGLEYRLFGLAVLMLELERESFDSPTVGRFGTLLDGDGLNVNAGAVFGTALGDVELTARKLTVPGQKEFSAGIACRW